MALGSIFKQLQQINREIYLWLADRSASPSRRARMYAKHWGISSDSVVVGRKINIRYPSTMRVGRHCLLNDNFSLLGGGGCTLGSYLYTAPNVTIITVSHKMDSMQPTSNSVEIEDRVWIGHGAIILPGVKIGSGSVIGAGAVVTRDVPEMTIVAGNPAKEIGKREISYPYRLPGGAFELRENGEIVPVKK